MNPVVQRGFLTMKEGKRNQNSYDIIVNRNLCSKIYYEDVGHLKMVAPSYGLFPN